MTVAIVCSAVLGLLLFVLGANVSRLRGVSDKAGRSQLPVDPTDPLLKAIRAHGNAAEYVPMLAVLILLVAWRNPNAWAAALAIGATAARLVHAAGMVNAPSVVATTPPRMIGAAATYAFGIALAATALVSLV